MKRIITLSLLVHSIFVFSQQNLINVPSGEVTLKNKFFFQQQLNFNEIIQSNTTLDYGLGSGFEVGLNVLGLNFNEKFKTFEFNDSNIIDPYNPLVLINGLKQFKLSDHTSISVGSQFGINFIENKHHSDAGLFYSNFKVEDWLFENSNFVIGPYYNTQHYGGFTDRVGLWLGTEIPLNEKFHVLGESVLGNNALSYSSFGVIYYPVKWMPLTLGAQIPNNKANAYAIVFELTIIPL